MFIILVNVSRANKDSDQYRKPLDNALKYWLVIELACWGDWLIYLLYLVICLFIYLFTDLSIFGETFKPTQALKRTLLTNSICFICFTRVQQNVRTHRLGYWIAAIYQNILLKNLWSIPPLAKHICMRQPIRWMAKRHSVLLMSVCPSVLTRTR